MHIVHNVAQHLYMRGVCRHEIRHLGIASYLWFLVTRFWFTRQPYVDIGSVIADLGCKPSSDYMSTADQNVLVRSRQHVMSCYFTKLNSPTEMVIKSDNIPFLGYQILLRYYTGFTKQHTHTHQNLCGNRHYKHENKYGRSVYLNSHG